MCVCVCVCVCVFVRAYVRACVCVLHGGGVARGASRGGEFWRRPGIPVYVTYLVLFKIESPGTSVCQALAY